MSKPSNILIICSDQHHPGMAGYRQHPNVQTPHLDQLAAEGTHFTRAYCNSPVCTPSRASLLTGKYVHQIDSWFIAVPLDPREMTWPRRLTQAGYDTVAYGKMDLCGKYQNPGFSEFTTFSERPAFDPYPLNTPFDARLEGYVRPDKRRHILDSHLREQGLKKLLNKYRAKEFAFNFNHHVELGFYDHDREVNKKGIEFMRRKAEKSSTQPWVMWLGYLLPHWPFIAPQKYFDMYYPGNISWPHDAQFPNPGLHPALRHFQQSLDISGLSEEDYRRTIAIYYAMITSTDELIGEIVRTLKDTGQYDDTTIIYISDHGESCGEHGLFYKQCSYEGSVGVPLIIKGRGVPAGKCIDHPVTLVDLYPTLLELAGLKTEVDHPGHSWLPLIHGRPGYHLDYAFSEHHGNFIRESWYMLVRGNYKYTYYSDGLPPSLFNLESDPQENIDLAGHSRYTHLLTEFDTLLHTILDPEDTARRSKRDLGLIGPDGTDYTRVLHIDELVEGRRTGRFAPEQKYTMKH